MKISDVLWEAACLISDKEIEHSCLAIHSHIYQNSDQKRRPAKRFYEDYFSPKSYREYWWSTFPNTDSQNQRFFHLLMAYEMAKGEGL